MLIPCERCKRHISTREKACPFCDHGNAFVRVGAVALSAGLLLGGCDAGKGKQADQGSAVEKKRPYATLSGRVTDRSGKPLGHTWVQIAYGTEQTDGHTFARAMFTDANGHYLFDLLEPVGYKVYFGYGGDEQNGNDDRAVVLQAGEDQTVDVVLDLRYMESAKPYGAPPARRRVV